MDDAGEIAAIGLEPLQRYYGQVLGGTADLQTDACSTAEAPSPRLSAPWPTSMSRCWPATTAAG